jgi:hypothetical protein
MRFWIAAFLITLFAFQALPVMALGKSCIKAKVSASESPDEDGGDEDDAIPEPGKLKKDGPPLEDYYLRPAAQAMSRLSDIISKSLYFPTDEVVVAASGHAKLDTPPPDRH